MGIRKVFNIKVVAAALVLALAMQGLACADACLRVPLSSGMLNNAMKKEKIDSLIAQARKSNESGDESEDYTRRLKILLEEKGFACTIMGGKIVFDGYAEEFWLIVDDEFIVDPYPESHGPFFQR